MGKNSITRAYGRIKIGDNPEVSNKNYFTDERLQEQLFRSLVYGTDGNASWPATITATSSTTFLRPGKLRYVKPNVLAIQSTPDAPLYHRYNTSSYAYAYELWMSDPYYSSNYSDPKKNRYNFTSSVIPSSNVGFSFGGLAVGQINDISGIPNMSYTGGPALPSARSPGAALSWVDVPGTQIGNLFKHPPGRTAWFNEVGIVSLSQGNVEIRGPYAPDESRMAHMGYQIYYTKSGGAGRPGHPSNSQLTAPVSGTDGYTNNENSVFTDLSGQFLPSHAASGNHYIRINSGASIGTYKIKTWIDASSVILDASDIYVDFQNESGITWEMVTGPIGEYFFRKRSYFTWDGWSGSVGYYYSNYLPLTGLRREIAPLQDTWSTSTAILHDRGACWWALSNHGSVPLMRWVHNSPQSFEPMHTAGKISGLSTWPFRNGYIRDIDIDLQNKLWIVGDPASSTDIRNGRTSVLRIDPYPAGDAAVPSLVSGYSADMSALPSPSNPLGANDIRAVVCDNSGSNGLGTSRVWLIPGPSSALNGLSYTDDYGSTWSRIHVLHSRTGTASVANNGTSITGIGTLFLSEFAVGDWVRLAGDSRSYRISLISSDTSMQIETPHVGARTGATIQRGGIDTLNLACTRLLNLLQAGNNAGLSASTAPADYDSSGNLFWISEDGNYVVKWDNSAGKATALHHSALSSPISFESGALFSLTVHRIPSTGSASHSLKNYIWVGSRYQGMTLINPAFDGTHTRYERTLSNNWPTTMNMPEGSQDYLYMPRAVINYKTGSASIFGKNRYFNGENPFHFEVGLNPQNFGQLINMGVPMSLDIPDGNWRSHYAPLWCAEFDEVGIGSRAIINPTFKGYEALNQIFSGCLVGSQWLSKRWYSGGWHFGPVNALSADIDFRGAASPVGPYVDMDFYTGNGAKRMHPDWQVLDEDTNLQIRFTDTSVQTVAQEQQFLVDETTTFICWMGQGKDNTQTAQYGVDCYTAPTIVHMQTETDKAVANIWTQDGGVDGGYSSGNSSDSHTPPFYRGISMPSDVVPHGGGSYANISDDRSAYGSGYHQYTAALRLNPYAVANPGSDGVTFAGANTFTAASMTFNSSHIGMSIFIKGSSSNPDNGQAIITALVPGDSTSVVVDKTFVNGRSGLSWKILDVPLVSYVIFPLDYAYQPYASMRVDYTLFSSKNRGSSWDQVKYAGAIRSLPYNADITTVQDYGIYFGDHDYLRTTLSSDLNATKGFSVVFDLRSLPENLRRRQHWKLKTRDAVTPYYDGAYFRGIGLHLYDSNMNLIGVPSNCMTDYANDADFKGTVIEEASEIALQFTDTLYTDYPAVQDKYTDTVYLDAESSNSFYLFSAGYGGGAVNGSTFSITDGPDRFSPTSVGKHIRISDSSNPSNDGFATITAYISGSSVTLDRSFTAESNSFSWAILAFAPGDSLRVHVSSYSAASLTGSNLADTTFTIADVPDERTIKLASASYPAQTSGMASAKINIEKYPGLYDQYLSNYIGGVNPSPTYDAQNRWSYCSVFGTLAWSEKHEFVTLQSDVLPTATSSAGVDGDAFTDTVVISSLAVPEVAVGDFLILQNSTLGTRVFKIRAVDRNLPVSGQTRIKLDYDEVPASQTFTWRITRSRGKVFSYPKVLTTTR